MLKMIVKMIKSTIYFSKVLFSVSQNDLRYLTVASTRFIEGYCFSLIACDQHNQSYSCRQPSKPHVQLYVSDRLMSLNPYYIPYKEMIW